MEAFEIRLLGSPLLATAFLVFAGCGAESAVGGAELRPPLPDEHSLAELKTKLQQQDEEIASLNAQIKALDHFLEDADRRIEAVAGAAKKLSKASFDPGQDQGFGVVETGVGLATVSVETLNGHADGAKMTINIGNVTNARILSSTIRVRYGSRYSDGPTFQSYADWEKTLRTTEIKIVRPIEAGAWNLTPLLLPKIKPEELGFVEVSLTADTIQLQHAR